MTWRASDLSITLWAKPSLQGLQQVAFAVTYGAFAAAGDSWLDAGDIERFAKAVDRMWSQLAGEAELYGEHGIDFTFRLTMKPGGHVGVYVHVQDAELAARIEIEAETDQTFLPSLRDGPPIGRLTMPSQRLAGRTVKHQVGPERQGSAGTRQGTRHTLSGSR